MIVEHKICRFNELKLVEKEIKDELKQLSEEIKENIDLGKNNIGDFVVTRKLVETTRVDYKTMMDEEEVPQELIERYTKVTQSERLTIKENK